jgi:DNA-binding transcriptional ArsR family regulator
MVTLSKYLGRHPILRIIDFLIENEGDFSKKQIAEGCKIAKGTLFKHWKILEDMGIVKVSRKFGKTKLYKIDEKSPIASKIIELREVLLEKASKVEEGEKKQE